MFINLRIKSLKMAAIAVVLFLGRTGAAISADNHIAWEKPVQKGTLVWTLGHFPDSEPWVAKGAVGNGVKYPVSYAYRTTAERYQIVLRLHANDNGIGTAVLNSFGPGPEQIEIRPVASQYPSRACPPHAKAAIPFCWNGAAEWWGPSGAGLPDGKKPYDNPITFSNAERAAQALSEVVDRLDPSMYDLDRGIVIKGKSYGGLGAFLMAQAMPEQWRSKISEVHAEAAHMLPVKGIYQTNRQIQKAWGEVGRNNLDFIDMRISMPAGKVDHIHFNSYNSSFDVMLGRPDIEFYQMCNTYKVSCSGIWTGRDDGEHAVDEIGYSLLMGNPNGYLEHGKAWALDPNQSAPLNKPLPVITNYSENNLDPLRGHYNKGISWNTAKIKVSPDSLVIPLKYTQIVDMTGIGFDGKPLKPVIPDMAPVATFDLTVRRPGIFKTPVGTAVDWAFGSQRGTAVAGAKDEVTITDLHLATSPDNYTDLVLSYGATTPGSAGSGAIDQKVAKSVSASGDPDKSDLPATSPRAPAAETGDYVWIYRDGEPDLAYYRGAQPSAAIQSVTHIGNTALSTDFGVPNSAKSGGIGYGLVYTRSPRSTTPNANDPRIRDESNWQSFSDTARVFDTFIESDVVYQPADGPEIVLYNCTSSDEICAAQDQRVSPDGNRIVFSVTYSSELEPNKLTPNGVNSTNTSKLRRGKSIESKLFLYDISEDALHPIPHIPGVHDRMPDWINNEEIVFASDRAGTYPIKPLTVTTPLPTQFGRTTGSPASNTYGGEKSLQIWRMKVDGRNAENLTPHEEMALKPFVATNGDIYYSCWQSSEQKAFGSSNGQARMTLANLYWLCRVNQHGGDYTVLLKGHKSPITKTKDSNGEYGADGHTSRLIAVRQIGEDTKGNLYITNYYRGNHKGLGTIYTINPVNPRVEGCSTKNCDGRSPSGSGRFFPSSARVFSHFGRDADNPPFRMADRSGRMTGKAGFMNILPGGRIMITRARGWCYTAELKANNANSKFLGGEPLCDTGIYQVNDELSEIYDPFTQLTKLIDSTDYFEWDADPVSTYQSLYGQPMPTQQPDYSGNGCYLDVVDATKHELYPMAPVEFQDGDVELCSFQGCRVMGVDHAAEIKGIAIHRADMWRNPGTRKTSDKYLYRTRQGHRMTLLGVQPLESDGSVRLRVPCETPLLMSGVDSNGAFIAHDSILHSVKPGEHRTCHGCHDGHSEERWAELGKVPAETRFLDTLAAATDPAELSGNEHLTFDADIEPILAKRCYSCHTEWHGDLMLYDKIVWDYRQMFYTAPTRFTPAKDKRDGKIYHVYIDDGGVGYKIGEKLIFHGKGSGASGEVSHVDESGAITGVALFGTVSTGKGYSSTDDESVTVDSASGRGAVLASSTRNHWLSRPLTSKWISKFARESLFYWKCLNERTDGNTDGTYSNDIDFGADHVTSADPEECYKIARWIDIGAVKEG